jgi:hypothetical protein
MIQGEIDIELFSDYMEIVCSLVRKYSKNVLSQVSEFGRIVVNPKSLFRRKSIGWCDYKYGNKKINKGYVEYGGINIENTDIINKFLNDDIPDYPNRKKINNSILYNIQ